MSIYDCKKVLAPYLKAKAGKPEIVNIPAFKFLSLTGKGDPSGKDFVLACGALYSIYYTIKFSLKKKKVGPEYTMAPMDGLWWMPGGGWDIKARDKWLYQVMIMQPPHITAAMVAEAVKILKVKKPNPYLSKVKLITFKVGKSAQILHIGPYSTEAKTLAIIDAFVKKSGLKYRGKHHEIYFGDPRRTAPSKLKTILRHPVQ
jgi:hypothetical protein